MLSKLSTKVISCTNETTTNDAELKKNSFFFTFSAFRKGRRNLHKTIRGRQKMKRYILQTFLPRFADVRINLKCKTIDNVLYNLISCYYLNIEKNLAQEAFSL